MTGVLARRGYVDVNTHREKTMEDAGMGWTPVSQGEFQGETRPANCLIPDVQPPEL